MNHSNQTAKRLTFSFIISALLALSLCITTYALFYATVTVEGNQFSTGIIDIDLNNGAPIIEANEYLFEPGMTVEKPFYIQNNSSDPVYYKLYFDNVSGGLAEVLEITILNGEKVLYQGTASTLTKNQVAVEDTELLINEKRTLKIRFHYPEKSVQDSKDLMLKFDFCADAVQTKNNPNKNFN